MIVADSSAWIAHLRDQETPAVVALHPAPPSTIMSSPRSSAEMPAPRHPGARHRRLPHRGRLHSPRPPAAARRSRLRQARRLITATRGAAPGVRSIHGPPRTHRAGRGRTHRRRPGRRAGRGRPLRHAVEADYCAYISDGGGQIRCDTLFLNDRGFLLKTSGKARKIKITDTIADPDAPVLAYGKTFRRGPFRCTSRRTGLTCKHRSNGHGFFLSRERQRVF